ncbi:PepSY domain-containing protein [Puniceicoccaceae bacterium K14]|nr:PepSY domain-containing protein [Puniceicoccaceae bacterium K14]
MPSQTRLRRRRKLRRLVNRIHLWAAIIGSLPALLLCLSGLILIFESELQNLEEYAFTKVKPEKETLPLEELLIKVEKETQSTVKYLSFPQQDTQVAMIRTENDDYHFVNPYNGDILKSTWVPAIIMQAIRVFHTSFFMGDFGTWIGIVSSLFLITLCITGCYLFLKRKLSARTIFRIRWKPASRRNYDLHAITGFITAIPIILIALSGALIGLGSAWRETILFLTNSEFKPRPNLEAAVERSEWNFQYEEALAAIEATAPEGMFIEAITFPQKAEDPIRFRLLYNWATRPASWAFIDPKNGELIEFHHHWDYDTGHLIHRLNRGFHSGELYTDLMRWLWFFLMIAPFILAYTGYRQWRQKKVKNTGNKRPLPQTKKQIQTDY